MQIRESEAINPCLLSDTRKMVLHLPDNPTIGKEEKRVNRRKKDNYGRYQDGKSNRIYGI